MTQRMHKDWPGMTKAQLVAQKPSVEGRVNLYGRMLEFWSYQLKIIEEQIEKKSRKRRKKEG